MSVETPFRSATAAIEAYNGSGGGGGAGTTGGSGDGSGSGNDGSSQNWGEPKQVDSLEGGWVLLVQEAADGSQQRWFVAGSVDGSAAYLNDAGKPEKPAQDASLADVPSFGNEEEARAAHEKWAKNNSGNEENGEGETTWTEWSEYEKRDPWFILRRKHRKEDREQFAVVGQNSDGETVYLQRDGSSDTAEHIYETIGDVEDALKAYNQRDETDEDDPTGEDPEDDPGDNKGGWSDWERVEKAAGWHILVRSHEDDREQYLLAGKNGDGETVYLNPEGKPQSEQHIFDNTEAMGTALERYQKRVEDGAVDPSQRATGDKPDMGKVNQASSSGGLLSSAIGAVTGRPIVTVAVVAALYYYYYYQGGSL